ncbi:GntR family transcriptional regulator [Novosphingobium sp.]|uniref:GntR family transcriptional regulator n=1 Tax=Novosphingobium sp. TaxID=1874826 RepID=UPI002B49636B|nr:GntR family transcriptional regulator [Novosphingobium sp.]HKR93516.1 GntR family transcriptional regulator [Novosphingobium sp.]
MLTFQAKIQDLSNSEPVLGPTGPTLASTVAGRLRSAIIAGEMAPGSKINIHRVRAQLGVSLSPLREALSRLFSEGFLTFQDKRGYRVAPVSERDLRQIIQLRINLETLALREAIDLGDSHWEHLVLQRLAELRAIDCDPEDPHAVELWEQAHRNVHVELLSACGMPLLLQFVQTLHDLYDRYRRIFLAAPHKARDPMAEHVAVATAAIERRKSDAVALLKRHIEKTGTETLKALPRS